ERYAPRSIQSIHNATERFEFHHMQVNKEMNAMFSTKKITMMLKQIVSRMFIATFVVIIGMVGTAAAARPAVISTSPTDGAIGVPVNTIVTVNFSEPMDCKSIKRNN